MFELSPKNHLESVNMSLEVVTIEHRNAGTIYSCSCSRASLLKDISFHGMNVDRCVLVLSLLIIMSVSHGNTMYRPYYCVYFGVQSELELSVINTCHKDELHIL